MILRQQAAAHKDTRQASARLRLHLGEAAGEDAAVEVAAELPLHVGAAPARRRGDRRGIGPAKSLTAGTRSCGCRGLALKRQLGVNYPTVWLIHHQRMQAMAHREERYVLLGQVQVATSGASAAGARLGASSASETFGGGVDPGSPVSIDDFDQRPIRFDGKVQKVTVRLK